MIAELLHGLSGRQMVHMRQVRRRHVAGVAVLWVLVLAAGNAAASSADQTGIVHAAGTSDAVDAEDADAEFEAGELEALVAPIALYPDDLLAVVLPAATYPLQIVEAARYLEALEEDPSLEPDVDWDQSIIALLNYPEVVAKLNEDLDWTADLGEAVMTQEEAVLDAVDRLRRRAHAAGNLTSDGRQRVEVTRSAIAIHPADPGVIYVPYYEPRLAFERRHYRRVIHYYPRPCPVYYYPYPAGHYLASRHFWGTTSAFSIAWHTRNLHFHLLDHTSHPYYGYDYAFHHYRYWEPRLYYRNFYRDDPKHRYHDGNRWRHRYERDRPWQRVNPSDRKDHTPFTRPPAATGLRGNGAAVTQEQVGLPSREDVIARGARRASPDRARSELSRLRMEAERSARLDPRTRVIRRADVSPERQVRTRPKATSRAHHAPARQSAGPAARMHLERATPRVQPKAPRSPAAGGASPRLPSAAEGRSPRGEARGRAMRAPGARHPQ